MSIQIDDAGWGSLIGGTIIGAYREETGESAFATIPVEQFQGEAFARKDYRTGAVAAAQSVLEKLGHRHDEPVTICTGYVLDSIREYLENKGYCWQAGKITGPLQELIENRFLEELQSLGVKGITFETMTEKQGLFFWLCVKWLKGGNMNGKALPDREQAVKTGWSTYRCWSEMPYEQAKAAAKKQKAATRERY